MTFAGNPMYAGKSSRVLNQYGIAYLSSISARLPVTDVSLWIREPVLHVIHVAT